MADNTQLSLREGDGDTIATDDIGGVKFPRTKLVVGAEGVNDGDVASGNPLPITGTVAISGTVTVGAHAVTNAGTFAVQVTSIAAGDNNIGNVDVVSLPALPAGTNNIGDVDVLSLPALPAGTNNIGDVDVLTLPAITGTVTANAGTNLNTSALALETTATSIKTATELIDDTVATLGTTTYTEATTKGLTIGAVRRDADTTLVGTTNEIGPLQMDANGYLKVEIFDGGGSHTVDGTVAATQSGTWILGANSGVDIGDVTLNNASIAVTGTFWQATQPVSGTVTANLAAGTNNIGDVDVLTVPADPFGANADAASATGSISAKLRFIANTGIPITGTVTVGSHAVTNAGTFATQAAQSGTWTVQPGNTANTTAWLTHDSPGTTDGLTLSKTISAASTNATSVKASAGKVYHIYASNVNAAARYLKLYNKASAPTVGTDTPVLTYLIPGNTAGAGFTTNVPTGLAFATGIAFALTTGAADADTGAVAASELVVNLGFK